MSTITIPARFVSFLHTAAVFTISEEAQNVANAEWKLWEAVGGPDDGLDQARADLASVRETLDLAIPLGRQILDLPLDQDAELEEEPTLLYYVLANMAGPVLAPRIESQRGYLPVPDVVQLLGEALAWSSKESRRLEAESVRGADA